MDTYAYDQGLPCKNPNCKSHGRPHPNCRCYLAMGGSVCASKQSHVAGCEYYVEGGGVPQENPHFAIGHSAIHQGLSGIIDNVGKSKLQEPDKHKKMLEEAQAHYKTEDSDNVEAPRKTLGVRLATHAKEKDHESMAYALSGHPLMGAVGQNVGKDIMSKLSPDLMTADPHPEAFRSAVDYLHSAVKGHSQLEDHVGELFKGDLKMRPDKDKRERLKVGLSDAVMDPEKFAEVGGNLGHYLPGHGAGVAAMAQTTVDYLNSIKPTGDQPFPLDPILQPNRFQISDFNRQVDIAEKPQLVLQHIQSGTLIPQDVSTLQTIYPALYHSMMDKVGEQLMGSEEKDKRLPYRTRQALSLFLGKPLETSQTAQGMQAIIKAQGMGQMKQAQKEQAQSKYRSSAAKIEQSEKVDEMYALPNEKRQLSN